MKNYWRTWKRFGLILSLVFGAVLFFALFAQEGLPLIVESIYAFGFVAFLGFVGLSLLNFLLYTWRWQLILHAILPANQRILFGHIFLDRMAGFAVSYLTPAAQIGGEPARIASLHADGVPLKPATSSVALDVAFELLAYTLFILAGIIFAVLEGFTGGDGLVFVFFGLSAFVVFLCVALLLLALKVPLFSFAIPATLTKQYKAFYRIKEATQDTESIMAQFLRQAPKQIFLIIVISLCNFSLRLAEVFYVAFIFGVGLTFSQAFLVTTLPGIALLLPVPAGLGLFEGGFSAVFTALSIPLSAISFALIIRARDAIFIALGVSHLLLQSKRAIRKSVV